MSLVVEWAALRQEDLREAWERTRRLDGASEDSPAGVSPAHGRPSEVSNHREEPEGLGNTHAS